MESNYTSDALSRLGVAYRDILLSFCFPCMLVDTEGHRTPLLSSTSIEVINLLDKIHKMIVRGLGAE